MYLSGGIVVKSRKDEVLEILKSNPNEQTAQTLADQMNIDRTNISRYLNELTKEGRVKKSMAVQLNSKLPV